MNVDQLIAKAKAEPDPIRGAALLARAVLFGNLSQQEVDRLTPLVDEIGNRPRA